MHTFKGAGQLSVDMSSRGQNTESEDLLKGQTVFKGPRKVWKNLLNGDEPEDTD